VSEKREPYVNGALGSVRQLEGALEAASTTRAASEARLNEARSEASRLLAAARDEAAAAAAERRRVVLAAAEDDAAEIYRRGEESAARLRADARVSRNAAVEAALAIILPAGIKSEA
jgi:vacuolar-type H+-ATPase subunit H